MSDQPATVVSENNRDSISKAYLEKHLLPLKAQWPHLYECIDPERIFDASNFLARDNSTRSFDFESIVKGGRGELYRRAQENALVRKVGILQLFEMVSPASGLSSLSPEHKILDVLGGDGLLARALQLSVEPAFMPSMLVSDISQDMVAAARSYGLFALQQAAQNLMIKDESVDGVIIAYGSHHIARSHRLQACQEAYRVLKPGGKIALHDFEENSGTCQWFSKVVDLYSLTGHDFPHFSREEMRMYLTRAGFEDVQVRPMYDPFILYADTEEEAKIRISEHVLNMYGLVKLVEEKGYPEVIGTVYALMSECFQYDYKQLNLDESFGAETISITKENGRWKTEVPRVALVGYAAKPANSRQSN
jgi:SAM-dependent methyltransferase